MLVSLLWHLEIKQDCLASPRIALFENAKIPDVRERLVSIEGLKEMQDKQIAFLASLLQ